jgi:hypothetical protein
MSDAFSEKLRLIREQFDTSSTVTLSLPALLTLVEAQQRLIESWGEAEPAALVASQKELEDAEDAYRTALSSFLGGTK